MKLNGSIGTGKLQVALLWAVTILLAVTGAAKAQTPETLDIGTANIHVLHVRGNIYMLIGAGCNITVDVGDRYIIVVDTGLPQFADEVVATIHKISKLPIMFIANTTSDADHTGGNAKLYAAGGALPNATTGFAREDEKDLTRLHLLPGGTIITTFNASGRTKEQAGMQTAVTFGREGFKLYDAEPVIFYNMGKAHTDGDSMVFFRSSDVISAGELYTTTGYPVIETENGGSIDGYLDSLNDLLALLVPKEKEEGGTYVIPGHGYLSDRADVANYRDMVTVIRARIADMIRKGMTLQQVMAAKPTMDYDGIYGVEGGRKFTEVVYGDLAKGIAPQARK
jgi:glyoxylase-like metal-dependent hydrolase (beta-lactamase superfamily II)